MPELWPFSTQNFPNLRFPDDNSGTGDLIGTKFGMWVSQVKTQVKFEYGSGPMIFWQSYGPFFDLENCKILVKVSFSDNKPNLHEPIG